jgi:hypothetical protein
MFAVFLEHVFLDGHWVSLIIRTYADIELD